jgi:hypothetical protein
MAVAHSDQPALGGCSPRQGQRLDAAQLPISNSNTSSEASNGYQKCNYSPVESDRRKEVTLALSSADASPLYGFILLPGTISSGFAMKRFSFASSQTKPALFIALE